MIHLAAAHGHLSDIITLKNCDPTITDVYNNTPIHKAVRNMAS